MPNQMSGVAFAFLYLYSAALSSDHSIELPVQETREEKVLRNRRMHTKSHRKISNTQRGEHGSNGGKILSSVEHRGNNKENMPVESESMKGCEKRGLNVIPEIFRKGRYLLAQGKEESRWTQNVHTSGLQLQVTFSGVFRGVDMERCPPPSGRR